MSAPSDAVIIGAGIVGLWSAIRAAEAGLSVHLIDRASQTGGGASGGLLGALMPHQPTNWTDVKQFQRDALVSLETEIATLEAVTGLSCGYARCGRLIPVRTPRKQAATASLSKAAAENWPALSPGGAAVGWSYTDTLPDPNWLSPDLAPLGCEFETLSARVDPRALLNALRARAMALGVRIDLNATVTGIAANGRVTLSDGSVLATDRIFVTAGVGSFDLLIPLLGPGLGRGVKGQAALLAPIADVDPRAPILYDGGLYVIAHGVRRVAIGSTSEDSFDDGTTTDAALDDLIVRAQDLCPALRGTDVIERWAGIRPKAIGRQPIVGPLPDAPRIVIASGGFKISFGVAHVMADAAIGFATGTAVVVPERLTVGHHIAKRAAETS